MRARARTHTHTHTHTHTFSRWGAGVKGVAEASNIVFSNGGYDPWSFGGVTPDTPLPAGVCGRERERVGECERVSET